MRTVLQVMEATEGGTRRHLRDLVGALDPSEFRVLLAVSCGRERSFLDDVAGYEARGVGVCEVPMRRGISPLADLVSLVRLLACVRRAKPDLIHAHSSKAGFLSRLAGFLCGVPVVYTPHGFPFLMACGRRRQRLYRWLERSVRGLTAALIAVSEEEVREAVKLGYACSAAGRGRVVLVPNGVGRVDAGPVQVRESEPLKVGFFGRLTRQKGPDVLVEAAADVVAHVPHVQFLFYGDGELAEGLRRQVEELQLEPHMAFRGAFAQGEAVALMRQVDVVAVPSRWEGCPYVVLEAFQAGVPVVASSVGGVPDVISQGANGICVAPDSPEALCDGLLVLLRDPQKRRHLAEQARSEVACYTVARMANAVAELYRSVCAGPTGK